MSLDVACPKCKSVLRAPDEAVGRKVKCKKCEERFIVSGGAQPLNPNADSQALSAVEIPTIKPATAAPLAMPPAPPAATSAPAPVKVAALIAQEPVELLEPDPDPVVVPQPVAEADPFAFDASPPPPPAKSAKPAVRKEPVVAPAPVVVAPEPVAAIDPFAFDTSPPPPPVKSAKPAARKEPVVAPAPAAAAPVATPAPVDAAPVVVAPEPVAAGDPFAFDASAPAPVPAKSGKAADRKEPVAVVPEPAAAGDPFAFDAAAPAPSKSGKPADRKEPAVVAPAPVAADDPFSFDAGKGDVKPAREKPAREKPAPAKKDDAVEVEEEDEPKAKRPRAKSGGGKKKLVLILGAVVVTMCLGMGGVGAAVYYLVVPKLNITLADAEATKPAPAAENPPPQKAAAATPDPKAKAKGKDAKATPAKEPEPEPEPKPGLAAMAAKDAKAPAPAPPVPPVAPAAAAAPVFKLPAPPAGKTALVASKKESLPLEVPAEAIHGVQFSSTGPAVAAVLWRSQDGFQGAGAIDALDLYVVAMGRRAERVEFSADGFTGPRLFDLSPGGERVALEGAPGKLTVYDFATKQKLIDGIDPFAGATGRIKPITAIRFLDLDHVAVFDVAGSVDIFDVTTKARSASGPVAPPGEKNARAAVSELAKDRVYVFSRGGLLPIDPKSGAPGAAVPVGEPSIVPLGVAVDPLGKYAAVVYRTPSATPPHTLAVVPLTAAKGAKTQVIPLPAEFATPAGVRFTGSDAAVAVLGDDKSSALLYDLEGHAMIGYLKRASEPAVQVPDGSAGRYWWVIPDPQDAKKSVMVSVEMPFDEYLKVTSEAKAKKAPAYLIPQVDGLAK